MIDPTVWPAWVRPLAWTAATLAVGWSAGWLCRRLLRTRHRDPLADGAVRDRAVLDIVAERIGLWCLLLAGWLALGYWPLTPEARLLSGQALFAAGTLSITLAAAAVASHVVGSYGVRLAPALPVSSLTRNIAWAAVVVLGVLTILNGLGLSIAPMLTALGVGGLAVALALQEPLANFFAGLFVTLAGQLRVGDYVVLDSGQQGFIVDFSWRSTRLRMLSNSLVIVPNAKLAQSIVVNHHRPSPDLAVLVEVGVDYSSDLSRVVGEVGREVMAEVEGGIPAFAPFIRYHTFADSSVNFTVILRAREFVDQYLVKHEFIKRLHARFDTEAIQIPFPIRTLAYREPDPSSRDSAGTLA